MKPKVSEPLPVTAEAAIEPLATVPTVRRAANVLRLTLALAVLRLTLAALGIAGLAGYALRRRRLAV